MMSENDHARSKEAEEIIPNAGHLVESLRDFGYTLQTALADLIDNSITAGAKKIKIVVEANGKKSHIAVVDNGDGMSLDTLIGAMRMGSQGVKEARSCDDLGRFGLGLKTASLSQGRCLTVASKKKGHDVVNVRQWSMAYIKKRGWRLLDSPSDVAKKYIEIINRDSCGTAVIIEELDRPGFLHVSTSQQGEHLGRSLETVRQHISMMFHRFIKDGVTISLGTTPIKAWDPFIGHKSSKLHTETIPFLGQEISITPYVLPHHSKLTEKEHQDAAGPNGWNAHQGFYIYRCRRLIVPGTWLNLQLKKEEHLKLARICVDLPNSLDAEWHLNVMKSHVASPAALRDDFKRIAADVRRQASGVYRMRGERQAPSNHVTQRYVWKRESGKGGVKFRVDRSHPVIRSMLNCGCDHEEALEKVIALIEQTIPVASMLQEPARSIDGSVGAHNAGNIDDYVHLMTIAEQFFVRTGKSLQEAREIVLKSEPFVHFRDEILKQISE